MCPVGQTLSAGQAKPSFALLQPEMMNKNGLGGHVLLPDSDLEHIFYDNSSSSAWKKRFE